MGKEPVDVIELNSRYDPEKSLVYYLKTRGDLIKVAKEMVRDEITPDKVGR